MQIYLIRHLKTQGNLERRYIGRTDESLVQTPEQDARIREMKGTLTDVEKVVASPMKRCLETAELLYTGIPLVTCENLRECDFGLFENKNYEELKSVPEYQIWLDSEGTLPFPGGEAHEEFCQRCTEGFEQMLEQCMDDCCRSAAFVVHGGTIMAILERFSGGGESFYHWQVENGGGYRMTVDEEEWKSGRKRLREIEKL